MNDKKPLIIAHRGSSAQRPENTFKAFEHALVNGRADMIEFDIHFSRDGIPVILHDARLDRTTNGNGFVSQFDLKDLKSFDAGFQFDPEQNNSYPYRDKGLEIPTFDELITAFPKASFVIEIKENSTELTEKVIQLLNSAKMTKTAIIGSRYHKISQFMQQRHPSLKRLCSRMDILSLLIEHKRRKPLSSTDPQGVASVPPRSYGFRFDSADWIQYLHRKRMNAFYWTVDDPEEILFLAENGADGIITNNPEMAAKTLGRDF